MAVGCFNQPSMVPPDDKVSLWGTGGSPSPPNSNSNPFHSCWSPIPNSSDASWHSVYNWITASQQASALLILKMFFNSTPPPSLPHPPSTSFPTHPNF